MARRIIVHVNSDTDANGILTPRLIYWKDGRVFRIDAVTNLRPADTVVRNISGWCYTVIIRGKTRRLFLEYKDDPDVPSVHGRWFVLDK